MGSDAPETVAAIVAAHRAASMTPAQTVARSYQRIEELRLGERLRVVWNIGQLPMQAIVPGLLLQPLLENPF